MQICGHVWQRWLPHSFPLCRLLEEAFSAQEALQADLQAAQQTLAEATVEHEDILQRLRDNFGEQRPSKQTAGRQQVSEDVAIIKRLHSRLHDKEKALQKLKLKNKQLPESADSKIQQLQATLKTYQQKVRRRSDNVQRQDAAMQKLTAEQAAQQELLEAEHRHCTELSSHQQALASEVEQLTAKSAGHQAHIVALEQQVEDLFDSMVEAEEEMRSLQQDTIHHAADDILPADPASSSSSNGQSLTFVSTKSKRQYSTDFRQKLQQWMSTYRERGARTKRKVQELLSICTNKTLAEVEVRPGSSTFACRTSSIGTCGKGGKLPQMPAIAASQGQVAMGQQQDPATAQIPADAMPA